MKINSFNLTKVLKENNKVLNPKKIKNGKKKSNIIKTIIRNNNKN